MCSSAETILYFNFPWAKCRERLAGVYRYAVRRKWQVVKVEYGRNFTTIKDVLRFWKPDGCLVENDYLKLSTCDCRDFGDTPIVYFDPLRSQASGSRYGVIHDSVQTAELGVKELPVRRKGEWILFDCSTDDGTIYYELTDEERPNPAGADFVVQ